MVNSLKNDEIMVYCPKSKLTARETRWYCTGSGNDKKTIVGGTTWEKRVQFQDAPRGHSNSRTPPPQLVGCFVLLYFCHAFKLVGSDPSPILSFSACPADQKNRPWLWAPRMELNQWKKNKPVNEISVRDAMKQRPLPAIPHY